jgi:glycerol-3-phosphate acyltransferase PlsY
MTTLLSIIAIVACAYLLGSVPFAVIVSRAMGLKDPRSYGSKNPGATNVLRTGNKKAAVLTLLGDALKGWIAVSLATYAVRHGYAPTSAIALSAVAVFLGHLYPIFLRFKGGKGVATALGILLAVSPWLGLATAATWCIVAYAMRYSSLAAILAAIFAPLYYILGAKVVWPMNSGLAAALTLISVLVLIKHQANISRLLRGKETPIGHKGN